MLFLCGPLLADEPRTPDQLKSLSDGALAAAQKGDLGAAISTWLDILDEVAEAARPDIHANLAVAYKMGGHLPEAWHHLTTYLKTCGKEDKAAAKELEALEGKLTVAYGKVGIACEPADSRIYLDFEPLVPDGGEPALAPYGGAGGLGAEPPAVRTADEKASPAGRGPAYACPLTWWFLGGDHEVLVVKSGFRPYVLRVTSNVRGGIGAYTARLEEIPMFGYLEIEGAGKAIQVFINGALEGKVPFRRKLKPGSYEIMVGRPGEEVWKKTIVIEVDKTLVERPPNAQPEVAQPDPVGPDNIQPGPGIMTPAGAGDRPFPTWQTVLMAGGAALLAAGGVVQYLGYAANQDLLDKYPEKEPDYLKWKENQAKYKQEFSDSVAPLRTTAYALYGLGGAAAAAGIVWLIVGRADDRTDDVPVPLSLSPLDPSLGVGLSLDVGF